MSDDRQKMFDKHREASLEREFYNAQAYDKAVLTLSTAALGFSFAFFRFVENPQSIACIACIVISWGSLFLAIVCLLLSFWIGNKAILENIENAREYFIEKKEDAFNKESKYHKRGSRLSNASGILFAIGIFLFGIFAVYNIIYKIKLNGDKTMSDKIECVRPVKIEKTIKVVDHVPPIKYERVPVTKPTPKDKK